jgi:hypothetical protein
MIDFYGPLDDTLDLMYLHSITLNQEQARFGVIQIVGA